MANVILIRWMITDVNTNLKIVYSLFLENFHVNYRKGISENFALA